MELVGVHLTCLLKKTQSSFEKAHHWNIQAKFYSVKVPHIAICSRRPRARLRRLIIGIYKPSLQCEGSPHSYMHDDNLYGVQGIEDEVLVWISQKEQQYAPFSLFIFLFFSFSLIILFFWWPQWFFLFNSHLSSLGSFDFVLFGIF